MIHKSHFLVITALFILITVPMPPAHADTEKLVSIPVSFTYSSVYWWRGVQINGDGVGVLWPGIALEIGTFSLSYGVGISEDWISKESSAEEDEAKAKTEMDYGLSFSSETEILAFGIGIMYVQYPYYDEANPDATEPSYWEGSAMIGVKTVLSPALHVYYDYFIEEYEGSDGSDVPVNEDYYVKFSLSQGIIATDGFTFSITAWVGYYNNPYLEAEGWSDAVVSLWIAQELERFSFSAGFYYGRTLDRDFRRLNNGIKNNFWCDFGIVVTL
jgi:hypothetical protein